MDRLRRQIGLLLGPGVSAINGVAAGLIAAFLALVLHTGEVKGTPAALAVSNAIALAGYLLVSLSASWWWSHRSLEPALRWVPAGRSPEDAELQALLGLPRNHVRANLLVWLLAVPVFVPVNLPYSAVLARNVGIALVLGGLATSALRYLVAERVLRPVTSRALAMRPVKDPDAPGVISRLFLSWFLGTGIPLIGIGSAVAPPLQGEQRAGPAALLFLVGIGLLTSGVMARLTATSIADAVRSVTAALTEVERGRLDVEVPVYDGSEVGRLQAGFNAMVEGLRERQRLHDLFGRQVGGDVVERALERGVEMGGETAWAAALFVDVIGSTRLAETRTAPEVMAVLNRFFAVVVEVVDAHGGFVNKFEGDAALCVFGVPVARGEPTTGALRAAREIAARLERRGEVFATVGVSGGTVVAGNVGTEARYEYTIIGDPVNEAARLCELAKQQTGRVLASHRLLDRADPGERGCWRPAGSVVLRGRSMPTALVEPIP